MNTGNMAFPPAAADGEGLSEHRIGRGSTDHHCDGGGRSIDPPTGVSLEWVLDREEVIRNASQSTGVRHQAGTDP